MPRAFLKAREPFSSYSHFIKARMFYKITCK